MSETIRVKPTNIVTSLLKDLPSHQLILLRKSLTKHTTKSVVQLLEEVFDL